MVTVGLLATLTAEPGKEDELSDFLSSALTLAEAEPATTAWFAIKIDDATFGIFDVFPDDDGRQAHLGGPIAAALMERADELLASPPDIKPVDVLASKLPR
jgi:quinol monooxygenase YgiN